MELYSYQTEALEKLGSGKILYGSVGSGKSVIGLEFYVQNYTPRPLYIITTAKKRNSGDWQHLCGLYSITSNPEATMHGSVVVDSWNNIEKYVDVEDSFFIFDEQRVVGSGAWVKAFYSITKKNPWILLSATPGDTWLDYIPVFVANGFYKNATEFKYEHVMYASWSKFPKVERYFGVKKLVKHRDDLLVKVEYSNFRVEHDDYPFVGYDVDLFNQVWKKKRHIYKNRPLKNRAELGLVARKVTNSSPERMALVREKLKTVDKLIIFYNFNFELDLLRELKDETNVAEWNGHKHEPIPATDKWVYLVQISSGAEGWECIETNQILFYSLPYSYRMFKQARGRIDRLNSPYSDLFYTMIRSKSPIDWLILKALKEKRDFNLSALNWQNK